MPKGIDFPPKPKKDEPGSETMVVPTAMEAALSNPSKLKGKPRNGKKNKGKYENGQSVQSAEIKAIPPELREIYGDTVPPETIEMYEKLRGEKKRESYIAMLRADEAERIKREISKLDTTIVDFDISDPAAEADTVKEVAPNERQQRKLIKVMLAPAENVHDILNMPDADVSSEERAEFMALLSNPHIRESVVKSLNVLLGSHKRKEYAAQLQLMIEESGQNQTVNESSDASQMTDSRNKWGTMKSRFKELNIENHGDLSKMPKGLLDAYFDIDERMKNALESKDVAAVATIGKEIDALMTRYLPKASVAETKGVKVDVFTPEPSQKVESKGVPSPEKDLSVFRKKLLAMERKFVELNIKYGENARSMPEDILNAYGTYEVLNEKMRSALKSEDMTALVATGAEIDAFMAQYFPEAPAMEIETPIPVLEEVVEPLKGAEGTPKEWREKLRGLITSAKDMAEGASERFTKSRNYLNERAKEIDAQAQTSKAENTVRRMGELYNKLNWREKLGIGLVLGAGAVVTGGALLYAFGGLLGVQRSFGMASLYLNQEKELLNAKVAESGQIMSLKERASISAVLTGAVMGAAIGKSIEWANESGLVERTREWLGGMFGHPATVLEAAPSSVAPTPVVEAPAVAAAGEAVAAAPVTPEMPEVSVDAVKGQGYEYMMKRVWEGLQDKGLNPEDYPKGSDIRQLLEADADSINNVVHQIAADPAHGFFNADGSSVRIDLDSQMTINTDGNIQLDEIVKAPEGAPATPVYHPEAPAHASALPVSHETAPVSGKEINPLTGLVDEQPPAPVEERVLPSVGHEQGSLVDNSGNLVVDSQGNPIHTGSYETETPVHVEASAPHIAVNQFGLEISTAETHLYADTANHIFVYGGSPSEQANTILKYLTENPDKIVYGADANGANRIPWGMVDGKAVPIGQPVQTEGFLGFFKSFMKAPEPEEFAKIIK